MHPYKISTIVILALISCFLDFPPIASADQKPNILLVMADDMGWTDVGCFGSEIETPNIDAHSAEFRTAQKMNSFGCARVNAHAILRPGFLHNIMWFAPPQIAVFKLHVCAGKNGHEYISSDSRFSTESQSPDIYFSRFDIPIFDKGTIGKLLFSIIAMAIIHTNDLRHDAVFIGTAR